MITVFTKVIRFVVFTVLIGLLMHSPALAQDETISDTLTSTEDLGVFVSLLEQTNLLEGWDAQSALTIFAPTDEAFAAFPPLVLDYLSANPELLRRILNYHTVDGAITSEALFEETSLTTLEGGDIVVSEATGTVNSAQIVVADIEAGENLIHVIDNVMLPEIDLPPVDPFISFDDIATAGSSTVGPLTARMRDVFEREGFSGRISVAETGTNVGIESFCVNIETDIANASRPIREAEIEACRGNDIEPLEFFIAIDALAVTVSLENTFIDELNREQLAQIFSGGAVNWSEIDDTWPDLPIVTLSPGADSGTLVYFVDEIFDGDRDRILQAGNIQFSEDDNVLVTAVAGNEGAIGYFGFAYFIENQGALRVIDIEGVTPNEINAESGEYPLSRPLYIYTSAEIMREKPQVAEFIKFYIENAADQLGPEENEIGYFPVNSDTQNLNRLKWLAAVSGQD